MSAHCALPAPSSDQRIACLVRTLQPEVIARLEEAHRSREARSASNDALSGSVSAQEVEAFTSALVRGAQTELEATIAALRSRGLGGDHPTNRHRELLVRAPGEQHGSGLSMVAEFFRRAGWEVASAGEGDQTDPVTVVRRASCQRELAALVGGPPFTLRPQRARQVGADPTTAEEEAGLLAWPGVCLPAA